MSDYGLDTWYTGDNAEVDIVFVHGLRGHREKTWQRDGILWPKELLSQDVEKSRIMSFGYDSNVIHSDTAEVTQGSLNNDARSLCSLLQEQRSSPETSSRPIILVAHSLGGLVCAQAIVLGERSASGDGVEAVAKRVKGMIFLGTPFAGSNKAKWGELALKIFNAVRKTDQTTLKTLQEDSNDLKELGEAFPDVIRKRNSTPEKVDIVFFFETLDYYKLRIVEQKSAAYPGIGEVLPIRANHMNICKFDSRDDDGYKIIKAKILQIMRGEVKESSDEKGGVIFNNYDRVINQSARDININSQTFS